MLNLINLPIIDFHSHLCAKELQHGAQQDVANFLLQNDHYKWRLIKNSGFDFEPKSNYTKEDFYKFYASLKNTINNPVKKWFTIEMEDILGIENPLGYDKDTLWLLIDEALKNQKSIFDIYNIETIYTTDYPCADLSNHKKDFINILPTYRVDPILNKDWVNYVYSLGNKLGIKNISTICDLKNLIDISIKRFANTGSKLMDLSLTALPKYTQPINIIEKNITVVLNLPIKFLDTEAVENIQRWLLDYLIESANKHKMVVQLHLGAKRNNSYTQFGKFGADIGCDSIGNSIDINILSEILSGVEHTNQKFIIYNSNPNDTYKLITLADSFGDNIKVGPPWWFLDNEKNIEDFISTFDNISVLGSFIGMTTDSRSIASISRHKWFRQIMLNYLSKNTEDQELIRNIASKIFYHNIKEFLK